MSVSKQTNQITSLKGTFHNHVFGIKMTFTQMLMLFFASGTFFKKEKSIHFLKLISESVADDKNSRTGD